MDIVVEFKDKDRKDVTWHESSDKEREQYSIVYHGSWAVVTDHKDGRTWSFPESVVSGIRTAVHKR